MCHRSQSQHHTDMTQTYRCRSEEKEQRSRVVSIWQAPHAELPSMLINAQQTSRQGHEKSPSHRHTHASLPPTLLTDSHGPIGPQEGTQTDRRNGMSLTRSLTRATRQHNIPWTHSQKKRRQHPHIATLLTDRQTDRQRSIWRMNDRQPDVCRVRMHVRFTHMQTHTHTHRERERET
uniref:Uncharacterized protein n=1 Tax=Vitrella brassicaformis TaxID=1169539 RepID=A0A7S1JIG1_9ALVE|mmetsp:Transcript_1034/g.2296  ORF Transcript_1034/g.2296 Transcript_1034/m.2296 type:complete len:177 (+) Transcript_1034:63-593(+)